VGWDYGLMLAVEKFDASGTVLWSKRFGGSSIQSGGPFLSVAVDGAGDVLVTGQVDSAIDFGGGAIPWGDGFVAELDSNGNYVWSQSLPQVSAESLAVDSTGNVLVAGVTSDCAAGGGCLYVAKLDASGQPVWSTTCGGELACALNGANGIFVAVDGTGDVVLAGGFQGSVDFGGGTFVSMENDALFAAKLDPDGNHLWSKSWGNAGTNLNGIDVAVDTAGNVILSGWLVGSVDLGGGPLTSGTSPNDAETYGGYVTEMFAAKLDATGEHVWSKTFGYERPTNLLPGPSVAVDGDGNVWLTGFVEGVADFGGGPPGLHQGLFVAKLDGSGGYLWAEEPSSSVGSVGLGIATDSAGDAVVVGLSALAGQVVVGFVAKFAP
jgi:hypothetical protein